MNKYYEEIINTIGNTYNHFIDVSINKDLSIFNIELGEFAQIKLELINIQQNKDKVLEEINKQSEIILLDVKKVDKGYEIPLYINNKELRYKVVLYCEDIICRIRPHRLRRRRWCPHWEPHHRGKRAPHCAERCRTAGRGTPCSCPH